MTWLRKLFPSKDVSIAKEHFPLYFKNGPSAFEMVCKYMRNPLAEGNAMIALVDDPRGLEDLLNNTGTSVKTAEDGSQTAMLRVANDAGTFSTIARTATGKGPKLLPGDLVAWVPMQKHNEFGWVGLIVAKLKPEYVNGAWAIEGIYE